jgi:hypothetical protein
MMKRQDAVAEEELDDAKAVQRLVNSGMAWHFEGSVGRACMEAIRAGWVMLGVERRKDAYGGIVPSRTDVQAGTKGSYAFVVEHCGKEWADELVALEEAKK